MELEQDGAVRWSRMEMEWMKKETMELEQDGAVRWSRMEMGEDGVGVERSWSMTQL